jgi:hypothetical protein
MQLKEPAPQVQFEIPPQTVQPPVPIPLNTRIYREISTALLTASMQRKIQRHTTFTQQDIVTEAVTDWLRKHGYWGRAH